MIKRTLALVFLFSLSAQAQIINLELGASIQDAINSSSNGDIIQLASGTYKESFIFSGKAITLKGTGTDTILSTTGFRPIITFNNDESQDSIVENLTLTKGLRGGAILIDQAAPIIRNCLFYKNKAIASGSGIITFGKNNRGESALFTNNVFFKNKTRSAIVGNIAHAISVNDSSPIIANNTFLANDRAGVYVTGNSAPLITNNIFAYMGFIKAPERKQIENFKLKEPRGRAIYLENLQGSANIQASYNISFNNKSTDVYYQGEDFSFSKLETESVSLTNFTNNLNSDPSFTGLKLNKKGTRVVKALDVNLSSSSSAINTGNPDAQFNDLDSSRSDIGATGGPNPFDFSLTLPKIKK